jgi:hypothetical protein
MSIVIYHAFVKRNTFETRHEQMSRRAGDRALPAGVAASKPRAGRRSAARMTARKILPILALTLLGIAALHDLSRLGDALPWHRLYDFQDFYCAATAVEQRDDPYRYEPLHGCEHRVNQTPAYREDPNRVIPAPIPPYDFPPLELAARLPFSLARSVDGTLIIAAVVAAIAGMASLGVALDIAALALALPAGYLLLDAGQIVPFALVALVYCGVALARRRDSIAGVLAALTLIEPHLGLPVFLSVLLLVRRSRASAIATALVLAIVGVLTVGSGGVVEYLGRVLPAQAAAETRYLYQYSLTYVLAWIGLPATLALIAGQLSYLAFAALGLFLGAKLARVLGRRELLAYLPAAFSIIGGAYVHMVDLSIAIPAALVLATTLTGRQRTVAALALALLAVPWIAVWITKKLFLAAIFVVGALLWRLRIGVAVALATICAIALTIYAFELAPPAPFSLMAATPSVAAGDLAQTAWRATVAAIDDPSPAWILIKLPTWAALFAIAGISWSASRRPAAGGA